MKQRKRIARRVTVLVVVVAAVGTAVAFRPWERDAVTDTEDVEPSAAPTAAVTVGDLTTTVSLDGSVTFAGTTAVVHRIEGEAASATSTSTSGAAPAGTPATGASTDAAPVALAVASAECATPPVGETTTVPTTTVPMPTTAAPADTTTTTTVDPGATSSTDGPTTTAPTTTVSPTTPLPSAPPTTQACDGATTTTVDPTSASGPSGAIPSGGAPPSGAAAGVGIGTSGAAGSGSSSARATEIVTSVRAAGSSLDLGDVLYTVDGSPVVVMRGWFPAWRSLSTSSADGFDIAQLEDSLVQLGYDPDGDMTVDEEFDSDTEAAVERWQEGLGIEVTGEVTLGRVVFLSSASTISAVSVEVGDEIGDGDVVAELATPTQQVVIDVPPEDQQLVAVGTPVELGDVAGSVTRLRSVSGDSGVGVQAVITPATPIADAVEGAVVKVRFSSVAASSVLLVPVEAVASRLDGTYAVQVLDGGATSWVTVEIIGAAGQEVGVTGDGIVEGDRVVVPA